jgi:hypothetical protein
MNIHDFIPENGITRVNKRKYNAVGQWGQSQKKIPQKHFYVYITKVQLLLIKM